jgi:hypothetical protein
MNDGPSVAVEKPNQDKRPRTEDLLEGLYVLYNTINRGVLRVKSNLYQPKFDIVVTITL